jgi:hypothetical protein
MTAVHSQIVECTSDFHGQVREACLGISENILDDPTPLETGNSVFNQYARAGDDFIQPAVGWA